MESRSLEIQVVWIPERAAVPRSTKTRRCAPQRCATLEIAWREERPPAILASLPACRRKCREAKENFGSQTSLKLLELCSNVRNLKLRLSSISNGLASLAKCELRNRSAKPDNGLANASRWLGDSERYPSVNPSRRQRQS